MEITTETFGGTLIFLLLLFPLWLPALVLWFAGVRSRALGRPLPRSIRTPGLVIDHRTLPVGAAQTADVAVISYTSPQGQPFVLLEGRRRGGKLAALGDEVEVSHDPADPSRAKTCERGLLRAGRIVGVLSGLYLAVWVLAFWRVALPFGLTVVFIDVLYRAESGRGIGHRLAFRPLPEDAQAQARLAAPAATSDEVRQARRIGAARQVGARARGLGWRLFMMFVISLFGLGHESGGLLVIGLLLLAVGAHLVEMALPHPFGLRSVRIERRGSWGAPSADPSYLVVVERRLDGAETMVHAEPIAGRVPAVDRPLHDIGHEVSLREPTRIPPGSLWIGAGIVSVTGLVMGAIVSPVLTAAGVAVLGGDYLHHLLRRRPWVSGDTV